MEPKNASLEKSESQERNNLVAYWSVPLLDGVHTVEFEHGTKSGKRVLRVDGVEIFRRDWMFKLVGDEEFYLGKQEAKCLLKVDPMPNFAFSYSLLVDGKPLEKFTEKQSQAIRSWAVITEGKRYRIVFEKQTLNIYVNGELVEAECNFTCNGTEMSFLMGTTLAVIRAETTQKKQGVVHQLFVDGKCVEEDIIF
ncbi:fas apoptotic inhibitory molecule 1 [Diorhabda carinulata]|uniref:fas apoptotic inhibitory molecule 1 n=1 Tax=Diorhabda carinulata TaxID=1163345 RepID=UPI0025A1F550|nr:fas apoptotic inhibitory molecule 1 [Diorhabda carinulata]